MARLIVEAVSNEKHDGTLGLLKVCVSVSRADDGQPVTGLRGNNFRITNLGSESENPPNVGSEDYEVLVEERKWDPGDTEPSGVYDLVVNANIGHFGIGKSFQKGEIFAFGIQVREFFRGRDITNFGQTVVSLTSIDAF